MSRNIQNTIIAPLDVSDVRVYGNIEVSDAMGNSLVITENGIVFNGSPELIEYENTRLDSVESITSNISANVTVIGDRTRFMTSTGNRTVINSTLAASGDFTANNIYMFDRPIYLRGDTNHVLQFVNSHLGQGINGPLLQGFAGGCLGTVEGGQKMAIQWDANRTCLRSQNTIIDWGKSLWLSKQQYPNATTIGTLRIHSADVFDGYTSHSFIDFSAQTKFRIRRGPTGMISFTDDSRDFIVCEGGVPGTNDICTIMNCTRAFNNKLQIHRRAIYRSRALSTNFRYVEDGFQDDEWGRVSLDTAVLSDQRLKENIANLDPDVVLDKYAQLRPVTYSYKEQYSHMAARGTYSGFLLQDVEQVFPDLVGQNAIEDLPDARTWSHLDLSIYNAIAIVSLSRRVKELEDIIRAQQS